MKRLDMLTPIGLLAGAIILIFGIVVNGGFSDILSFIDIPSILIVFGGVFAALFVSFPVKEIKHMFVVIRQAFSKKEEDLPAVIDLFGTLSDKARREGLLSLEMEVEQLENRFIRKGVLLAIDGLSSDDIQKIMEAEIISLEERHRKGRSILEKAGEYAPAWGMIGTLIGLVLMLKSMDDPSSLGPNMAIALITTLYGALLANLFFLPIASKLELKTENELYIKEIMIEGIIGIQSGENSKILKEKLRAYLSKKERVSAGETLSDEI